MASPKAPVLSLSTVITRPTVAIDGKAYEMRSSDELSWLVYRGYANQFQEVGRLMQVQRRTPIQEKQLQKLLVSVTAAILFAPKPVLARLNTEQRMAVLTVFSALLPTTKRAGAKPTKAAAANATTH